MQNKELSVQLQRLGTLISRTDNACGDNIELRSDWAKYICILCAGLMENGLKVLYIEYVQSSVSKPVADFVSSNLSQIRNPKTQKFLELASAFKEPWKDELEAFTNTDGRGDAIDSIMNNRHLIAHGKSNNSNISMAQVKEYLHKSVEVLEFIEQQCVR